MEIVILIAVIWGGVALYMYIDNLKDKAKRADEMPQLVMRANAGDTSAQLLLGHRYRFSEEGFRNYAEAYKWFSAAAQQGHPMGYAMLGVLFRNGEGVEKDVSKAEALFKHAAEQGLPTAQRLLGLLYLEEHRDPDSGVHWLLQASSQGDIHAMTTLAEAYETGKGLVMNKVKACYWYEAALRKDPSESMAKTKASSKYNLNNHGESRMLGHGRFAVDRAEVSRVGRSAG